MVASKMKQLCNICISASFVSIIRFGSYHTCSYIFGMDLTVLTFLVVVFCLQHGLCDEYLS